MKNSYIHVAIIGLFLLYLLVLRKHGRENYGKAYRKRLLLTKNEWKNYMFIKPILEREGLRICPKVRLLDLVEPKNCPDARRYQILLNKVQSNHVDFVVCDEKLNVLLILELDDSSHDTEPRKKRDNFVDTVLTGAGYQIPHVRNCQAELRFRRCYSRAHLDNWVKLRYSNASNS